MGKVEGAEKGEQKEEEGWKIKVVRMWGEKKGTRKKLEKESKIKKGIENSV